MSCSRFVCWSAFVLLLALASLVAAGCADPAHAQSEDREQDATAEEVSYDGPYRPQYHLSPTRGWMGDPSGLVYTNGTFHAFWWDHATSDDLLHWTHLPKALEGTMSGSVVVDSANTSGFGTDENPPWVAFFSLMNPDTRIQTQGLAYSTNRGTTWTKYEKNPILDIESTQFRDPQVFWYEPDDRWIMVVALSAQHKVRFYASENLKDWTHLSDFGPAGAVQGVWECPDLFPVPMEETDDEKWVLEVDVQPIAGQYFVGHFDGTKFTLDSTFARTLELRMQRSETSSGDRVLFDFEGDSFGDWIVTGTAFGDEPASGSVDGQSPVYNFEGDRFANSFHDGDGSTGTMTSPSFRIDAPYLNVKVGGGEHPGQVGVHLLVNGDTVRTATGRNLETLHWRAWDVRDFTGQTARLQIIDRASGGWGHVNVDHVLLSEEPKHTERENAFWIDHGKDFYAVRSWHGMPPGDDRRIWMAWMSNWLYATDVPTEDWRGTQSIPRRLSLHNTPKGPRLRQRPVQSLSSLRSDRFALADTSVRGTLDLTDEHGVSGTSVEIVATVRPASADTVGVRVRTGSDQQTEIGYHTDDQQLYVDRRNAGVDSFSHSFPGVHRGPLQVRDGAIRLHILVDRSTLEVFGNGGRTVLSDLIFPDLQSDGIEVFARGGSATITSMKVWPLRSVWHTASDEGDT